MDNYHHPLSTKKHTSYVDPLQQTDDSTDSKNSLSIGIDVLNSSKFVHSNSTAKTSLEDNKKIFGGSQSYLSEWESICRCNDISQFREWAMADLSACRFRSICWRICLSILPAESSKWQSIIRLKRENYEKTRHRFMVTPSSGDALDPVVNNPLSQDQQSPWNQYFEDSELKKFIRLDVQRTFPEVEFFQSPRIQEMMVSILFCYVRKYSETSYIQGMHEILAPLTFVINYDLHVYKHSAKDVHKENLLHELMDETYLEHDSFTMFEAVMEKLYHWYEDGEPKANFTPKGKPIPTQPFARPQDIGPTTKIVQRLTRIHDRLLKKAEPEVLAHLNRLEIPPQVYGIRWARLMFGREFSFPDLLRVWDAIFADDSPNFLLIEYLMVAMLSNIRDKLLVADYITSLNLLMRYPTTSDVNSIIQMALYFRNPKIRSYPSRCNSFSVQTVGGQPNIHRGPQAPRQTAHGYVTRSSSLPRPQQESNSASLKLRSASVEQNSRSVDLASKKVSPTVHTINALSGVSYTSVNRTSPDEDAKVGENATTATTRVVSGLARLGERFGRPRDTTPPLLEKDASERPMNELKFVERSAPIPTNRQTATETLQTNHNSHSLPEDEVNEAFPQRSTISQQRVSVDDVIAVTASCAARLSGYQKTLTQRLSQLHIESEFTIRAALEGIAEVAETLNELKLKRKGNSFSLQTSAVSAGAEPQLSAEYAGSEPTTDGPRSLPAFHTPFSHPLMESGQEASES